LHTLLLSAKIFAALLIGKMVLDGGLRSHRKMQYKKQCIKGHAFKSRHESLWAYAGW
jgi:hypothetical protein